STKTRATSNPSTTPPAGKTKVTRPFRPTARLRMSSSGSRHRWQAIALVGLLAAPAASWQAIAVVGLLAASAASQTSTPPTAIVGPQIHAAIASSAHRQQVPAIAWLCEEFLPSLPQWPAELDPKQAFSVSLSMAGLRMQTTDVTVPPGAVAIGSCTFQDGGEG